MSTCDNTPNNSFTIKKNVHISCGYSMLTSYAYDKSLNEHVFYRNKDCLSKFSKTLKAQVNKIINIKQKPLNPLTEQEKMTHANANNAVYVKNPLVRIKMLLKLGITAIILVNTEVLLTMHVIYSTKYLKVYS